MRRGLREKILYATNPFPVPPPGVTWSEHYFAELCGIYVQRAARRGSSLATVWTYGQGAESEILELREGQMIELRESEARSFAKEKSELGYVLIEDPSNLELVKMRKEEGISRAIEFYTNGLRGADKLIELAAIHSLNEMQMAQSKREHWIYHVNAKIGEFLERYRAAGLPRDFGQLWVAENPKNKTAA